MGKRKPTKADLEARARWPERGQPPAIVEKRKRGESSARARRSPPRALRRPGWRARRSRRSRSRRDPRRHRDRRCPEDADARRRPGQDQVARLEREDRRDERDEPAHAEDQLGRVPVLEQLAVQPLHDPQPARVAELRHRHELRAERAERVEALRPRPLLVGALQVAGTDVVRAAVAGDEVERVVLVDAAAHPADLDRELGLGVDVRRFGRQHDRLARADQRRRELAEEQRLGRRLDPLLLDVGEVVEPGSDDFHAPI